MFHKYFFNLLILYEHNYTFSDVIIFNLVARFNDPTVCVNGNIPLHYNNNLHAHANVEGRSPGIARAATLPRNAYLPSGNQLNSHHHHNFNHLDEGTTSFNSPVRHQPLSVSLCNWYF